MPNDDFITGDEPDMFDPQVAAQVEDQAYEAGNVTVERMRAHLQRCKTAYTALFVEGNATPYDVDFVMRDLAWFCRAYDPLWDKDQRQQDRFTARREVYQRIMEYTRLDHETLAKRYIETQA